MRMAKAITLSQNAVAIDCAKSLYYYWGSYYQEAVIAFDQLPAMARHQWVERAKEALEAVGPRRSTAWTEFEAGARGVRTFGEGA